MKILIIGGTGMMGHRFWSEFSARHEVWGTIRGTKILLPEIPGVDKNNVIEKIAIEDDQSLKNAFKKSLPDVVINCIGIIKQVQESTDPITSIEINSLFPHRLAKVCSEFNARLILFSTDCVFDGRKGNYLEQDIANAQDLYGRTKFLGEISDNPNVLTIRTSIIGRELQPRGSLIEWFLSQEGKTVNGFKNAIYSGFPTSTLAKILDKYVLENPKLSGVYHISSDPISKYDLLKLTKDLFKLNVKIKEDYDFKIDRSLDSTKFKRVTGFSPTPWKEMIQQIDVDRNFYQKLR
jgi:dTDP-4-dehydrorhamnose reductase